MEECKAPRVLKDVVILDTSVSTYFARDKETEEHNSACTMLRILEGKACSPVGRRALNVSDNAFNAHQAV
jgi:hypothetical protein